MKELQIYEHPEICLETTEEVGFSYVPEQYRQMSLVTGFKLNLLVIGRRGLGSTTLINSLFSAPLLEKIRSNEISISKNEIFENNIKLNTIIITYHLDEPEPVLDYIKQKNLEYFYNERSLKCEYEDNRVFVCLYLFPLDEISDKEVRLMKQISQHCNFIPIITKADCFTTEELLDYKQKVLEILKLHEIRTYLPEMTNTDKEISSDASEIIERYPLCVVASESVYEHKGEIIRGRKYKWGFVDVDNPDISDFHDLRKILIHSYLDDLVYQTDCVFYEKFRNKCLENKDLIKKHDEEIRSQVRNEAEEVMRERKKKKEVEEQLEELRLQGDPVSLKE